MNLNHKHYHPNTKNVKKRSVKPSFNTPVESKDKCPICGTTISLRIDTLEHFDAYLKRNKVDFCVPKTTEIEFLKDFKAPMPDGSDRRYTGSCHNKCFKKAQFWQKMIDLEKKGLLKSQIDKKNQEAEKAKEEPISVKEIEPGE